MSLLATTMLRFASWGTLCVNLSEGFLWGQIRTRHGRHLEIIWALVKPENPTLGSEALG